MTLYHHDGRVLTVRPGNQVDERRQTVEAEAGFDAADVFASAPQRLADESGRVLEEVTSATLVIASGKPQWTLKVGSKKLVGDSRGRPAN